MPYRHPGSSGASGPLSGKPIGFYRPRGSQEVLLLVPNTLREVVRERISSLPSSEGRLLHAVAALPHPTFALLGEVAGRAIDASSIRKA